MLVVLYEENFSRKIKYITWPGKSANCRNSERSNLICCPEDRSWEPSNITDCEFNFPFESQQIRPMTDTSSFSQKKEDIHYTRDLYKYTASSACYTLVTGLDKSDKIFRNSVVLLRVLVGHTVKMLCQNPKYVPVYTMSSSIPMICYLVGRIALFWACWVVS